MPTVHSWISRVLTVLGGVFALYLGSSAGITPAWAHVHASSDNAVRGGMAVVTFEVPNESSTGATTSALTVTLPNVTSVRTESTPGWIATLDRDAASGTVRSVTWTAAPGGGIGPDQFGLFRISLQLPDADTVSFPATQTYADGTVVKWDQATVPGKAEPEHPAPALTLTAAGAPGGHHHPGTSGSKSPSDSIARLLGGAALVVAALGTCLVLIRRRA